MSILDSYKRPFQKSAQSEARPLSSSNHFKVATNRLRQNLNTSYLPNKKFRIEMKGQNGHTNSFDLTSNKRNKDLSSDNYLVPNKETLSPKSTVHSIIDQCYMLDNEEYMTLDEAFTKNDSMFELSQCLAENHNPIFRTINQSQGGPRKRQKSCIRPTTMATKKRVTFDLDDPMQNQPKHIDSESMSESLSSSEDGDYRDSVKQLPQFHTENRQRMTNIKRFKRLSKFYKPALMTKNFKHEMPMFLSEKNIESLAHLFKSMKFVNKYQKSINAAKKFKKLKLVNQQKTKTQDKWGNLENTEEVKSFLSKEPKEIFSNALDNFWFKDSDKFIRAKKAQYVKKKTLWDPNEPDVYQRMEEDRLRRQKQQNNKD